MIRKMKIGKLKHFQKLKEIPYTNTVSETFCAISNGTSLISLPNCKRILMKPRSNDSQFFQFLIDLILIWWMMIYDVDAWINGMHIISDPVFLAACITRVLPKVLSRVWFTLVSYCEYLKNHNFGRRCP
jgi:hypothetical protein